MADLELLGTMGFAFGAGVATFFSPCAYPLLPGYVGYYVSRAEAGDRRPVGGALLRGLAAGAGVLAVFAALAALAVGVGQAGFERLVALEPVIGAALVVVGLFVVLDRGPSLRVALPARRTDVAGFVLFGAVYALAAAGCVVPVVLGVFLGAIARPPTEAALVVGAYAGGVSLLMVATTVATGVGVALGTSRFVGYGGRLRRLAGAVMILAGLGQLYLSVVVLDVL
ncbi:cytochrome c biogenesis CcdA family protein [Halalkalicoccus jeotgali]|uniref:Cytochrome c biogenesis protein transmembrane region n=1 Tax=Halalkalicoccus jeotgali (strain DSM 18796 / CECT 7217 / JCM 14584 / KCTC 4019 / B3) TaxID=795797 RepID=D8J864_HALJB|nr:cytochrome c biogenesis protein CcdA [Halalkalicoccus jeotgali]ADJ14177.1 cytochrome c biogenesis protein transmembrane region [Halalkalicoccus jeotgali B3]ELY34641.1 cytochrome c biogenesis protein transmembrane region [Halalkalicoccus jeotgali B3]